MVNSKGNASGKSSRWETPAHFKEGAWYWRKKSLAWGSTSLRVGAERTSRSLELTA